MISDVPSTPGPLTAEKAAKKSRWPCSEIECLSFTKGQLANLGTGCGMGYYGLTGSGIGGYSPYVGGLGGLGGLGAMG